MYPKPFHNKPREVYNRYQRYIELYNQFYIKPIEDKNYETTLIRDLIMYFLHRENEKGNKFTMKEIVSIFGIKNNSSISHSNKKIKTYIEDPKRIASKSKIKFIYFYYQYNKIFNNK